MQLPYEPDTHYVVAYYWSDYPSMNVASFFFFDSGFDLAMDVEGDGCSRWTAQFCVSPFNRPEIFRAIQLSTVGS